MACSTAVRVRRIGDHSKNGNRNSGGGKNYLSGVRKNKNSTNRKEKKTGIPQLRVKIIKKKTTKLD